ncbi:hypothetical protein [Pandoraea sputorum]|uniref:hypothetical protein n=1 Tax=Pandoraea sputorum TaxID=93222 RepID=UPI002AF6B6D0|nr:hypothetical protein [Pandoraea sputorum]
MDAAKDFVKALGVVLLLTASLIFAVRLGMNLEAEMGDAGKSLSSWVQAVGSIAAILGAVYVTRMQMKHSDKNRRAAIVAIAEAAMRRVNEVYNLIWEGDPRDVLSAEFPHWRLDRVVSAFDAAPVHELQSGKGVVAFLAMREHLVLLQQAVKESADGPGKHPNFAEDLRALLDQYEITKHDEHFAHCTAVLRRNVLTQVEVIRNHFATLQGCL